MRHITGKRKYCSPQPLFPLKNIKPENQHENYGTPVLVSCFVHPRNVRDYQPNSNGTRSVDTSKMNNPENPLIGISIGKVGTATSPMNMVFILSPFQQARTNCSIFIGYKPL